MSVEYQSWDDNRFLENSKIFFWEFFVLSDRKSQSGQSHLINYSEFVPYFWIEDLENFLQKTFWKKKFSPFFLKKILNTKKLTQKRNFAIKVFFNVFITLKIIGNNRLKKKSSKLQDWKKFLKMSDFSTKTLILSWKDKSFQNKKLKKSEIFEKQENSQKNYFIIFWKFFFSREKLFEKNPNKIF